MLPYSSSNKYVTEGKDCPQKNMDHGLDPEKYPDGLATAPVIWDYLGTEFKLEFKSGFVGATQDQISGVVTPVVGWFMIDK